MALPRESSITTSRPSDYERCHSHGSLVGCFLLSVNPAPFTGFGRKRLPHRVTLATRSTRHVPDRYFSSLHRCTAGDPAHPFHVKYPPDESADRVAENNTEEIIDKKSMKRFTWNIEGNSSRGSVRDTFHVEPSGSLLNRPPSWPSPGTPLTHSTWRHLPDDSTRRSRKTNME